LLIEVLLAYQGRKRHVNRLAEMINLKSQIMTVLNLSAIQIPLDLFAG